MYLIPKSKKKHRTWWFAWYPVILQNGGVVWLQKVYVVKIEQYNYYYSSPSKVEYYM